ncbi:MAG TPA: hypothetical protein VEK79_12900 [Thermoanaerobaculia bacterium]|nr:hypothetical protein [Thermoanaerobaculia bacterium]
MMRRKSTATVLFLGFLLSETVTGQERQLQQDLAPLEKRVRALEQLLRDAPERFVTESLELSAAYHEAAKRHAKVTQSAGARSDAVTILIRAAFATRQILRQPERALDLYRRAAALHAERYPSAREAAFRDEIADIQQFDLRDHAAAANTLERLREFEKAHATNQGEMAGWSAWRAQWLDAEITYLRSKKAFAGTVNAAAMTGLIAQIYYGAGTVGSVPLDPALNIYSETSLSPAEIETKLAALPASHTTFLQTWMFATKLPTPAAAQKWLTRNDPAGYWSASLLTLAAVAERDLDASADPKSNVVASLIRTESRKPTAFALLARQYAKTRRLPPPMQLNIGH